MPDKAGKQRIQKKSQPPVRKAGKVAQGQKKILSRVKALRRISAILIKEGVIEPEVVDLIAAFQVQSDELTEIGVSYEMVRALEQRHPTLFMD